MQSPVIDWEQAIALAGNDRNFAKKMFTLLVKNLMDELPAIKNDYTHHHFEELKNRTHKLHGALCYCGAPRLKAATIALETALRNQAHSKLPDLLTQFELEANELIRQVNEKIETI
jgi:two-component system sensor histidine kinase BarA